VKNGGEVRKFELKDAATSKWKAPTWAKELLANWLPRKHTTVKHHFT
jgi:hypothetical protein